MTISHRTRRRSQGKQCTIPTIILTISAPEIFPLFDKMSILILQEVRKIRMAGHIASTIARRTASRMDSIGETRRIASQGAQTHMRNEMNDTGDETWA